MSDLFYERLRPFVNRPGRGPNGRAFCRECGKEVPPRRSAYCSDACSDAYLIPRVWAVAVARVYARDKGVCALCGRDAKDIQMMYHSFRMFKDAPTTKAELAEYVQGLNKKGFHLKPNAWTVYDGELWQVDHILPVVMGGGGADLKGLRTLCTPCHKAETKALAARRAAQRRPERMAAKHANQEQLGL